MKKTSTGLALRLAVCAGALVFVFFSIHLMQPVLNSGAGETDHGHVAWSGVLPAHAAAQVDGQKIYMTRCMSCHQMNGEGVTGVFPPLANSEWVTEDKGRLIRLILHGLTGEIKVQDVKYSGAMPPWGTFLKDEEIAALSTYIRSSWGNEAPAVTTPEVAAVRAATKDRKQPWTGVELSKAENLGIPGEKGSK